MNHRLLAAALSFAAASALAAPLPAPVPLARFDRCHKGGRATLACTHTTGRSGASLQIIACNEGRLLATLSSTGPTGSTIQTDALEVKALPAPAAAGGPMAWINTSRAFELLVNFTTPLVNNAHKGSFRFGHGPNTVVLCNKLR